MRILLIEDDPLIGDGLNIGLNQLGFSVDWFRDGHTGQAALTQAPFDAVVLDLNLPDQDGLTILTQWREQGLDTPVLILTARDTLAQRVSGLHVGADDYLGKPFALAEVAARLHALIRRRNGHARATLQHGILRIDPAGRQVWLGEQAITLSAREFSLLELFMQYRQRWWTREQLEEKLYSWDTDVESNAVEVHVHRLRRKLGSGIIVTQRGLGYQLGKAP